MIYFPAERLMELEFGTKTGSDYGEKNADQMRPKLPKLATLMDVAEEDVWPT